MTRVHLSLHTRDLAASRAFYATLLGTEPDKVREDYLRFQPAGVPIALAIMVGEPEPGPNHMGIKLVEPGDTKATWKRLEQAGLDVLVEGEVTCCWSRQNKAWVHDPDGRAWEVYTMVDDGDHVPRGEDSPVLTSAGGACCA
ncbi:MAG: hypothetical protein EP330_12800 [Deltaproteobacteria bacterium]|nr:MAG: hypothetical protein EP330_12800 [Deltaproteobacteria bacterium]